MASTAHGRHEPTGTQVKKCNNKEVIMFKAKAVFSGFSVDDLATAKEFYAETLGLKVNNEGIGIF